MKFTKKLICLLLVFACIFSLTGCGEIKKAETSVNGLLTAFKNADIESAQKYINLDDLKEADGEEDSITSDTEFLIQNMFKQLDYKIISSEKKDDSTVVVTTEITNTDMKPVMGEFFASALQYAFSNAFADPQPTEEETNKKMEELLIASLTKEDLATVTNTVDITVVKAEDKSWKIKSDDAFLDALLGGLYKATKELENSFNE